MKISPSFIVFSLALTGFCGLAQASTYYTNFNNLTTGGITNGQIAGQDGWLINDPTTDASKVLALGGAAPWGTRTGSLGFVAPLSQSTVFLYHGASTPLTPIVGTANASFSALFQVIDSVGHPPLLDGPLDPGDPTAAYRDKFGFSLQTSSGYEIFSFNLNPTAQTPTPESDVAFHSYTWSTGGVPTVALPLVGSMENNAYTFNVTFTPSGADVNFVADVNGSSFTGTLTGAAGLSIEKFGATWTPTNGASAPGSNLLLLDNVSLVPEPSSALLGLLGATFAFTRRRRA